MVTGLHRLNVVHIPVCQMRHAITFRVEPLAIFENPIQNRGPQNIPLLADTSNPRTPCTVRVYRQNRLLLALYNDAPNPPPRAIGCFPAD
jgi:hypothetical protein